MRVHSTQYFNKKIRKKNKNLKLDSEEKFELEEKLKTPNMQGITNKRIITFDQFPRSMMSQPQETFEFLKRRISPQIVMGK